MFVDGDLQTGIAQALQENKPIACFVRDESEESRTWEQSYVCHNEVASLLNEGAVTLRIESGSQEAGYLSVYFPVVVVPTLVIIYNGQVVAQLQGGMEFQDFKAAVIKALSPSIGDEAGRFSTETATSENDETRMRETYSQSSDDPSMATTHVDTRHQESTASEAPAMSNTTPPRSVASHTQSSAPEPMSSSLQQVLADRRRRLEADKPAKDAAEKEKRQAAAKAQREDASARQGIPASRQLSYAQEQRKRQLEAKEERLRILKAIENDKAERKEKEAQRRVLVETELAEAENAEKASKSSNERIPKIWGAAAHVQQCSLQIRLFDGSTIRGKFEPQYTLNKDVRLWLAKQRTDGDTPYTLKQILTPQMNRTLSISEEEESLQSLGLLPSATLVMVPIKGYTNMYANDQGMVSKVWSLGYAVASAGGSLLRGTLGAVLGFGRAAQDTWETESQGDLDQTSFDNKRQKATAASGQEGIKYRTVDQQRDEREHHELYNGNQLNFEPQRDEQEEH